MKPNYTYLILCMVLLFVSAPAVAKTKAFALVVGNNTAPQESSLDTLKFADDDAVRFYRFFLKFADTAVLMTVPDEKTQARYHGISSIAMIPDLARFQQTFRKITQKMQKARNSGFETVLYITYSGHGAYDESGNAYLTLVSGRVTHQMLFDAIKKANADYTHLFIDACYAGDMVHSRGPFSKETSGRRVTVPDEMMDSLTDETRTSLPGLGVLIAASENGMTHEWSAIESGVFTHELLSGLSGPADINLDGRIEYSEIVAFVSVANRNVEDIRGKIRIIGEPPGRNQNAPIVDLATLSNVAYLVGNPSHLGHFHVELDGGERYLDANLGDMMWMHVVLPANRTAYLYVHDKFVAMTPHDDEVIRLKNLEYSGNAFLPKGQLDRALMEGLFSSEYGRRYYTGFIDSAQLTGVRFDTPEFHMPSAGPFDLFGKRRNQRKTAAIVSLSIASVAAATAIVLGALTINAKKDFDNTDYHKPSVDADERYYRYSGAFWGVTGVMVLGTAVGIALMPKKKRVNSHGLSIGESNALSLTCRF
ncbi:MAG: caspase family protein [Deltaproteobacteria bacterium]|nr:caspase family protein [Deltaproteobacteria bacterium]